MTEIISCNALNVSAYVAIKPFYLDKLSCKSHIEDRFETDN